MKNILFLFLFLAGCSSTHPEQIKRLDPSWPDQVQTFSGDWKILVVGNTTYVGLPYGQFQGFTGFLGDVRRYTRDTHEIICYYRYQIKDPMCSEKTP